MKNIVYAIILSIIIHFLFLFSIEIKSDIKPSNSKDKITKKQHITYVKLKKKKIINKKTEAKKVVKAKEIKEVKKEFKKVIKKNIKKAKKRTPIKKPKRTIPKPKLKTVVKPTYTNPLPKKAKIIKKKKTKLVRKNKSLDSASKEIKDKTLESFLLSSMPDKDLVDKVTQSYLDLYGEEFNTFTKVQKVFLKKHLKDIGLITQKYMIYPEVSARTRQSGTNIVEFMLYPNGDIGRVMLSSSTGYEALDESSLRTIQIAYMDYPRPEKPTKIIIYMTYVIY